MNYVYFVLFAHSFGFGNAAITMNKKIESYKDIENIKKELYKTKKLMGVAVLNYKLLNKQK